VERAGPVWNPFSDGGRADFGESISGRDPYETRSLTVNGKKLAKGLVGGTRRTSLKAGFRLKVWVGATRIEQIL
jgi:hypothetical protein